MAQAHPHRACRRPPLPAAAQVSNSFDEFQGQTVIDLGCGTAMLSIGAAMLGACHVIGLDVDWEALEVAAANVGEFEDPLPASVGGPRWMCRARGGRVCLVRAQKYCEQCWLG